MWNMNALECDSRLQISMSARSFLTLAGPTRSATTPLDRSSAPVLQVTKWLTASVRVSSYVLSYHRGYPFTIYCKLYLYLYYSNIS